MYKQKTPNKEVYLRVKELGFSNLVAVITANRISDPNQAEHILRPTKDVVPPLDRLLDSAKAARIIYDHIMKGSNIVAITDSDSDGVSCAAIMHRTLRDYFAHPAEKTHILVNERKYGNGVNDEMVKRALEIHKLNKVDLITLHDHGSADDERFKIFKDNGIDVVCTDHHLIPSTGELKNVDAFVNPQRAGDTFSKHISGAHVTYLVMQRVYDLFMNNNNKVLIEDRLQTILPIMTNTILSDQMDMRDPINRYYLKEGLKELTISKDPIWLALRELAEIDDSATEETVSFLIAPLLNAANRTGQAHVAYEFLAAPTLHIALSKLEILIELNNKRKKMEAELLAVANIGTKTYPYNHSMVVLLPHGTGVAGLVSNTIGERLKRPTFTFVENEDGQYVGSGRGILPNINLKEILDTIHQKDGNVFVLRNGIPRYGGHKGAAGCTINGDKIQEFMKLFDKEVELFIKNNPVTEEIEFDFSMEIERVGDNILEEIRKAGPYGREYPAPVIHSEAVLSRWRTIGNPAIHAVVALVNKDRTLNYECFYPKSAMVRFGTMKNRLVNAFYTLAKKRYLGKTTISPTLMNLTLKD